MRYREVVGGVWACSEAQQSYLAGTTYLCVGDHQKAVQAADRAVWLYEVSPPQDRFYGAESLALLDSAIAHVLAGDLTSAAERLEPVFSLAPDKRVELICQRSTELQRAVERFGRTERGPMAALVDHIPDFLSAAG